MSGRELYEATPAPVPALRVPHGDLKPCLVYRKLYKEFWMRYYQKKVSSATSPADRACILRWRTSLVDNRSTAMLVNRSLITDTRFQDIWCPKP